MIGDGYFQLRAQIGTASFSLGRIAADSGADEKVQARLRNVQGSLHDSFLFVVLGPAASGKSALLNTLFERDFCGAAEPATEGRVAIFRHGGETRDEARSAGVVECERPHSFLRDFTLVDTPGCDRPGHTLAEDLAPILPRADLLLFVVPAGSGAGECWNFLTRLGRESLKRMVFVVSAKAGAPAADLPAGVKRLRQTMLRHLGQACPIFSMVAGDPSGTEKLTRWIESEIIFSAARRARFRDIIDEASAKLREMATQPRSTAQGKQRQVAELDTLRADLAEQEEELLRKVAGSLWGVAQSFDEIRPVAGDLLKCLLDLRDVLFGRKDWPAALSQEIDTLQKDSFAVQFAPITKYIEADLRHAAGEAVLRYEELFKDRKPPPVPFFSWDAHEAAIRQLDRPLELAPFLGATTERTAFIFRLPLMGVLALLASVFGLLAAGGFPSDEHLVLVGGSVVFVVVLAALLRRLFLAEFGHALFVERATFLSALRNTLNQVIEDFHTQLAHSLDGQGSTPEGKGESLLLRLQQLEEVFKRITEELSTGRPVHLYNKAQS